MIKRVLIGLFLLTSIDIYAQIYFNKRYDINNEGVASFSPDIIEEINGYRISFIAAGITYPYSRIGFFKLDSIGSVFGEVKIYQDTNNGLQTGYPGSFIKLAGISGYACVGTKMKWVPEGRYDRGWLLHLDNSLDTLWTKTYTDEPPHDTSIVFRNFRELSDGGYIVTGLLNPVDGNGVFRTGLFRLDSAGNLLWKKKYGAGNNHIHPFDVLQTSDQGFIIGAVYQPAGTPNSQGNDAFLIKTDSLGIQKWNLRIGNPECCEGYAMVDFALDGNLQVGTIYSDTCWGDDTWVARINFIKISNEKSIIWDKKYGFSKIYLETDKIRVLNNGDLIGTGSYRQYVGGGAHVVSWILRTDSAGNEKWYREYILLSGLNSQNNLWNVIPTNDGGFAACGYVLPLSSDTGTQDSWVLKVDSLGCEAPGECWVGQDEIWVKTFTPEKPFVVYPNPVKDKLTVEFHINPQGAEFEFYDLTGRQVFTDRISPDHDLIELDIGGLKGGLYILKVIMPGKRPMMEKVVVE